MKLNLQQIVNKLTVICYLYVWYTYTESDVAKPSPSTTTTSEETTTLTTSTEVPDGTHVSRYYKIFLQIMSLPIKTLNSV